MRPIFLSLLLSFISFTQGYIIDDRDSAVTYTPSSGSSAWTRFSDPTAYDGTTTDNACLTEQGCLFSFSFTGSGVSLVRFIITTIPIPLNATVTVDGKPAMSILVPDGSPDVTVYNLQSLDYGSHAMVVTLVSYNGNPSHFRLDAINVNETAYSPPPLPSSKAPSSITSTAIPVTHQTPSPSSSSSQNTPVAAISGGTVGGVALVCVLAWLLFSTRRKRKQIKPISEKELGPESIVSQFTPSGIESNENPRLGTTPLMTSPPILPPTRLTSTSTAATLAASAPLPPASQSSQYLSHHEQVDFDPTTLITPPVSPAARSISTSTTTSPRSNQFLTEEQVELVTGLYRQRLPASEISRIVESMLENGGQVGSERLSSGNVAGDIPAAAPPAYDFKAAM